MAEMSGRKQKSKKKHKVRSEERQLTSFFCSFRRKRTNKQVNEGEGIKEMHQESTTRGTLS